MESELARKVYRADGEEVYGVKSAESFAAQLRAAQRDDQSVSENFSVASSSTGHHGYHNAGRRGSSPSVPQSPLGDARTAAAGYSTSASPIGSVVARKSNELNKSRLSDDEVGYYSRHLALPNFGVNKQLQLLNSSILVIGVGGLGSSLVPLLAGAGIGRLGLVDFDKVERSNLHRQIIHRYQDEGILKVDSAARTINEINPSIKIETYPERLTAQLCERLFPQYDLIADCSDNLPTRLLISDYASEAKVPVVSGSALRFQGQVLIYGIQPGRRDNYRSLLGEQCIRSAAVPRQTATGLDEFLQRYMEGASQSCASAGVFGPVCGVIGSLMAVNCCKLLLGELTDDPRSFNFVLFDFCNQRHPLRTLRLRPKKTTPPKQTDYEHVCNRPPPILSESLQHSTWDTLLSQGSISSDGHVTEDDCVFCDVRPQVESQLCTLKGSNVVCAPFENLLEAVVELAHALRSAEQQQQALPPAGSPATSSPSNGSAGRGRSALSTVQAAREQQLHPVDCALVKVTQCLTGRNPFMQPLPQKVFVFCRRGIASVDACNVIAAARVALRDAHYDSPIANWLTNGVQLSNVAGGMGELKQRPSFGWVQILN